MAQRLYYHRTIIGTSGYFREIGLRTIFKIIGEVKFCSYGIKSEGVFLDSFFYA
jgi:hypothetical protein